MMKRFGIDIDGTVTSPSSIIPYINKDFNLSLTLNDIKQYDLTAYVPHADFAKWWKKNEPLIYAESPLAEGAKDILQKWKEQHELYFISARGTDVLDVTEKWFKEKGLSFHHMELIGSHNKVNSVKKHNIDIFFEDKHDNAVAICEECKIPVILFNTPYNQDPVPKGVIRVNNWQEANAWVEKWIKETK